MWGHLDDGIRSIATHISSSPDSSPSASGNSTPTRSTETAPDVRGRSRTPRHQGEPSLPPLGDRESCIATWTTSSR
jgi:hypothetical protein